MLYLNYQRTLIGPENGNTSRGKKPTHHCCSAGSQLNIPPQHYSSLHIQIKTSPSETIFKQFKYRYDRQAGTWLGSLMKKMLLKILSLKPLNIWPPSAMGCTSGAGRGTGGGFQVRRLFQHTHAHTVPEGLAASLLCIWSPFLKRELRNNFQQLSSLRALDSKNSKYLRSLLDSEHQPEGQRRA